MSASHVTPIQKQTVLSKLYHIYEQYGHSLDLACAKYCHDCCTTNVTMTTIEGDYILSHMSYEQRKKNMHLIRNQLQRPRFIPTLTTNRIAQACRNNEDFMEEGPAVDPGPCPLLDEGACRIYAVRPFGCRNMVSFKPCRQNGYAETDPFTLTVNTVFLQVIEHIDRHGFTGNLCDVLIRQEIGNNTEPLPAPVALLVPNLPLLNLFVPPEHRDRINPILAAIQSAFI